MGGRLVKGLLPTLAAACAAGGLMACGGGSSNTTTVTSSAAAAAAATATTPTTTTASTPAATAPKPTTSTQSVPSPPATQTSPTTQTSTTHLSAAASKFFVKGGDNSIPEYGQEAAAAERARAQAALTTFLHARAHDEWARVCTGLTASTRQQLEGLLRATKAKGRAHAIHGCGGVLAALSGGAAGRAIPQLTSVAALRVKGDAAFALFYGTHAVKYVMPMSNEGGVWKVGQLAPLPYPLGTPGVAP